ncbi:MAG: ArsC/Spx/MgsR family protein [Pseudomonadota bacterium]
MKLTVWGLKTCDTCRKSIKTLEAAGHEVAFRDIRADPLLTGEIAGLVETFGAAAVNRKSTTWRGLDEAERGQDPGALLAQHPTLMKRPVIYADGAFHIGWTQDVQAALGV